MKENLVSIIIPCYNGDKYLSQALESVLWQTHSEWECILIDDGSTDNSADVFKKYAHNDNRFRYAYQRNQGPAAARNTGLDNAMGEYIQFLDADDIILPKRFEMCVNVLKDNQEIDVVYTDHIRYSNKEGFWKGLPAKIPYPDAVRAFMFDIDRTFAVIIHAFFFRSKVIKTNRFNILMNSHGEDVECWIRVALSGARFHYIDEVLSVYRYLSVTLARDEVALYLAKLKIMETYKLHQKSLEYPSDYALMVQHYSERLAIAYFFEKDFKKGVYEMRKIWSSASYKSKLKLIGWLMLMIPFSKDTARYLKNLLIGNMFYKHDHNKSKSDWSPPLVVDKLLRSSDQ